MSMTHHQPSLEAVPAPTERTDMTPLTEGTEPSPYQPCDSCGAPLDERQRYCVACGSRRKHADDPAARYLATATRRRRSATGATAAGSRPRRGSASAATAAVVALIPLALGAGVLIGRSSAGGDSQLIAALHAAKPPVIEYSGGSAGAAATTPVSTSAATTTPPTSTFKLSQGYAVQLGTLPAGSGQSAATKAEQADQAKGAKAVGLIAQSDYRVTPSPPSGAYVIYAGSYTSRSAAQQALAGLKRKFPAARVITVRAAGASPGRVLNTTHFGSAHQVSGYTPNSAALSQGSQVANQDSHATGKAASGSGLPDVVAVP